MSHEKDWCKPQTGTAQCFASKTMEQDQCFSPVVGVFNGYYDLKLLIAPQNEPNVSRDHTDWTDCTSIGYDIFSYQFYLSIRDEWEFLKGKLTCTAMTVDVNDTSGKTFARAAYVYNIPVALKRKINSFIDGIPFFEHLQGAVAKYLQWNSIIIHNGIDYKVSLIREEPKLCEDVERETRVNTVPTHSLGTDQHVPRFVVLLCSIGAGMFSILN
ncbi:uncharacterized protein LOC106166711 [Lingula anatina]|uniref:Uncharacterized protein LOC106166711 n=1 Tax=Lingula anatina TaxID=7574 RepID=A0A1S3IRH1_LINAN|nr:uncharacterized protein LOC106166711 [Lingula anatina]|eukprot:XP_013400810.1 uncharacterized protein LOC106166711 [Lingula anatina]